MPTVIDQKSGADISFLSPEQQNTLLGVRKQQKLEASTPKTRTVTVNGRQFQTDAAGNLLNDQGAVVTTLPSPSKDKRLEATNLSEFYDANNKELPSVQERSPVYELTTGKPAKSYIGSEQQNIEFLEALKRGFFSEQESPKNNFESFVNDLRPATQVIPKFDSFPRININRTQDSEVVADILANPVTGEDIAGLIRDNNKETRRIREEYIKTGGKSKAEIELENKLVDIQNQIGEREQQALEAFETISNKVIPVDLITGQQRKVTRDSELGLLRLGRAESNLLARLGLAKDAREAARQSLKEQLNFTEKDRDFLVKMYDRIEENKKNYFNQMNTISDNARQSLAFLIQTSKGLNFEQLPPETQAEFAKLATNAGIPLGFLVQGLELARSEREFDRIMELRAADLAELKEARLVESGGQGKTYQSTSNIDGRLTRLTFDDAGNVINTVDLGAAPQDESKTDIEMAFLQALSNLNEVRSIQELKSVAMRGGLNPESNTISNAINSVVEEMFLRELSKIKKNTVTKKEVRDKALDLGLDPESANIKAAMDKINFKGIVNRTVDFINPLD